MNRLSDGVRIGSLYLRVIRQGRGYVTSQLEIAWDRRGVNQYGVRYIYHWRHLTIGWKRDEPNDR